MRVIVVLAVVWVALAGSAAAQTRVAPATNVATEPTTARADAYDADAWRLYHEAFAALARGDDRVALELLRDLVARYPQHRASELAREVIAAKEVHGSGARITPGATTPPLTPKSATATPPEGPTQLARAELAFVQTLNGVALGVEACVAADCEEPEPYFALGAFGGVIGLVASLSVGEVTPGHRAALNSGTGWGAWAGIALIGIRDLGKRPAAVTMVISQSVGLAAGQVAHSQLSPTSGQVSLVNTFGIWSGAMMLMTNEAFELDLDRDELMTALLVTSYAGLTAGAFVASHQPEFSRGRALIIDAGGLVGLFGGMGMAVIAAEDPSDRALSGAAMVGTAVGLGVATYVTRRFDAPELPARVAILPSRSGGLLVVGGEL